MFHLPAGPWPSSVDQLRQRLTDGLRPLLDVPERLSLLGQWPVLSRLTLDLSAVRIDPAQNFPKPKPGVERHPGPACRELRIWAAPLRLGDVAKPHIDLQAAELQFEFVRDEASHHWLIPIKAGSGSVKARIAKTELDQLFTQVARTLAKAQGFNVEDVKVTLDPAGPNAVRLEAEIGARKAFLKGEFRVAGIAQFDPSLNVQLRALKCEGIGPIGAIAARAIQPHLDRLGDIPLRPFGSLLSGFALEQLELKHGDDGTIELDASISAAPG
jgi:hypothetical protein